MTGQNLGMEIERRLVVPAPADEVFALVDRLPAYLGWMGLVHEVIELEPDSTGAEGVPRPAWDVELRARVGPLARSKRLRMVRTVHDPVRAAVFERQEVDGRAHAPWVLTALVEPMSQPSVELTMRLAYGGSLWTGAVLQRVLDDEIRSGSENLLALVAGSPQEPPRSGR